MFHNILENSQLSSISVTNKTHLKVRTHFCFQPSETYFFSIYFCHFIFIKKNSIYFSYLNVTVLLFENRKKVQNTQKCASLARYFKRFIQYFMRKLQKNHIGYNWMVLLDQPIEQYSFIFLKISSFFIFLCNSFIRSSETSIDNSDSVSYYFARRVLKSNIKIEQLQSHSL